MPYHPHFANHADADPATAGALDTSDGAPWALEDVIEACKAYRVSATLRDEPGFLRGRVDASGDYRLES
jgi:hypothetical protein